MKNKKIMNMVMTGLFAAMICVTTAYIMHIPAPNGYIHLGDVFIYAAASILPMPYGIAAAGIGGAMADIVSGYPVYVIPTLIIKSFNALCFYAFGRREKLLCWKTITASAVSCAVTIIGYYFAAVILYGNPAAQIVNTIPGNAIQGIASGVIFCVAAYAIDKTKIKFSS